MAEPERKTDEYGFLPVPDEWRPEAQLAPPCGHQGFFHSGAAWDIIPAAVALVISMVMMIFSLLRAGQISLPLWIQIALIPLAMLVAGCLKEYRQRRRCRAGG